MSSSNRSFSMSTLLKIIAICLLVAPVSFASAQEVVGNEEVGNTDVPVLISESEEEVFPVSELVAEDVPEAPAITISGVKSTKHADGSAVLTWQTNRLSAGAVTVLYREGKGYPDQLVQQRLTSGELSMDHRYVLRGLEAGEYSVVIEVVGVDMQYDRFTGTVSVPEVSAERSPLGFLLAWFVSLSFLIALVVLYEIISHRSEFTRAIKDLKKIQAVPAVKKASRRKTTTKKVTKTPKKVTKKTAPKK